MTTIVLVDWDWADGTFEDPCVRDAQGRSEEASVKVGAVAVEASPSTPEALWDLVNAAEWTDVGYEVQEGVRETVAAVVESEPEGCLLVVVRDESITGGFLR